MNNGEKRFARVLESHLEDDYLCWFEAQVRIRQRYTDFIILHPRRGLLLLEVKDWKIDSINNIDRNSFTLQTDSGSKVVKNPLEQVRECTYSLINSLVKDSALQHAEGKFKGKLICPYAFGVVFTNITRKVFNECQINEVIPERLSICKDEITAGVDPELFQSRLWDMFAWQFKDPLSLPQIDRVRWHLFPEIRIEPPVQTSMKFTDDPEEIFEDIRLVMDRSQERLARSLGDGHRVIHGVAGSGKTLILGYRCLHLAGTVKKPILVLCFNVALAARLREIMESNSLAERVHIKHFHAWCSDQLKLYNVGHPKHGSNYVNELVENVITGVEKGQIPRAQYGAVLIDEGHDFEPAWMELVVGMLDPDENSLLLLYDDAQSLYKSKKDLGFSLSSVGISARGRTTILRINYRNTDEIIKYAYDFASNWITPDDTDEDFVPLVEPQFSGRHGPRPVVKSFESFEDEVQYIGRCVKSIHERGTKLSDIAIVYRSGWMGKAIHFELNRIGVPVHWLRNKIDKMSLSKIEQNVKLMTMHSSKGLEYHCVIVAGVGEMPLAKLEKDQEAKLLYVAMTRATEKLLITAHKKSEFAELLLSP